jgi:hypothetical protein
MHVPAVDTPDTLPCVMCPACYTCYAMCHVSPQVGELARRLGFRQVSLSHEVMPMVKMVPRGFTAAADAYLTPHILR